MSPGNATAGAMAGVHASAFGSRYIRAVFLKATGYNLG